jgi:hypothetical protein
MLKKEIIEIIVKGVFVDIERKSMPYRVKIEMPDCIDEWLLSNIKRYVLPTIKQGKELKGDKLVDNKFYQAVNKINITEIEANNDGDLRTYTQKIPSFYGKSLFDFTFSEIQDFAVAFGLHQIKTGGNLDELKKDAFLQYIKLIKNIDDTQIKNFSFYKYDKLRRKYYLELTDYEKRNFIINEHECVDIKEFEEQDKKILEGQKSIFDIIKPEIKNTQEKDNKITTEETTITTIA